MSTTFLLTCFVCLKKNSFRIKKSFLFHLKDSFFHSWDNQIFSDIWMSWRHQIPKHETRNIFYWITWEVNIFWWCNLAGLCNITKENFLSKNSMKTVTWKLAPGPFQFSKNPLKRNMRRWWFGQILIFLRILIWYK